ncbi:Response regulator MprA [Tepidimonas taiwanensis]|uniref:Response regulator MprA n=2 Tax=Tepidimonas taiwanensis TaxID=307486 RepID=A0A554X4S6_9BURK|nr:Response regulator MprA [Tepidimonas taiwanensis]
MNGMGGPSEAVGAATSGQPRARVLIIDDSRTIRLSAASILRPLGVEVILAEDGFAALSHLVRSPPDLVFVDILMPRLDGYQTCALIRRHPPLAKVPVVMLSSKDGLFDRARARVVGCDDYLVKPFTRDGLLAAVRRYIPALSEEVPAIGQ